MSSSTTSTTNGKPITCKAAICWKPNTPMEICEIQVAPPKAGEVRVRVVSNALCATDVHNLEGKDPEGKFPCILGHEATAIVESVGQGVTSVAPGDTIIPCYTPECRELTCIFCQSDKTNLCPKIRGMQGNGFMPDGTVRFTCRGKPIFHFMGCSTFSEYTVLAEISCAKINPLADLQKVCVMGCGVSTGYGAVFNTAQVTPGSTVGVFGLGSVGLATVQAAKLAGARKIYAFDLNKDKFSIAKQLGADICYQSTSDTEALKSWVYSHEQWGLDFTFDATGNTNVMNVALELCHRGWGKSTIIGVAAAGKKIGIRPFNLVIGKEWLGTAFGQWCSRSDVPKLVNKTLIGDYPIDQFITHTFDGLEKVNEAVKILHSGECLRSVINITPAPKVSDTKKPFNPQVIERRKLFGGTLNIVKHWSQVNNCEMTFSIFFPTDSIKLQRNKEFPILYYLSGLTCDHTNAITKSGFAPHAVKHNIAMVFPDTSPRGLENFSNNDEEFFLGYGAGYYVDSTTEKYKKHFQMDSYITQELPNIVNNYFPVDSSRVSIMGHSMGGFGALSLALRNPKMFKSVSALSPIAHFTKPGTWGASATQDYLGSENAGKSYDPVHLVAQNLSSKQELFIDQGTADPYMDQLNPLDLVTACHANKHPVKFRWQGNYDHSYYYVASVIEDHVTYHSKFLGC